MGDAEPRLSDGSTLPPPLTTTAATAATPAPPHPHVKPSVDSTALPANDAHCADAMTSPHNNTKYNGVHQEESKTEPAAAPPPARPSSRGRQSSPSRDIIAAVRAALQTEEGQDAELQTVTAEPAASSSSSSAAAAVDAAAAQPSKSSWFDIDTIHKIEIRAFPEFFGQPPPPAPPHSHTVATHEAAGPPPSLPVGAANHTPPDRSSGASSRTAGSAAAASSDTATTTADVSLLRRRSAELSFNPFRTPQVSVGQSAATLRV